MRVIVAVTGASGALYAQRLLHILAQHEKVAEIAFVMSEQGRMLFAHELGVNLSHHNPDLAALGIDPAKVRPFHPKDLTAPPASGSARYDGMVIVPCSTHTLAKVAGGFADDLIGRAAQVMLKERRKLVLVTRETPLSLITLRNMVTVTEAGAVIVDANPGFYTLPRTVQDLVDFVVQRVCDQLGLEVSLLPRWELPQKDDLWRRA
ncbi:Flavin prenyltransferase UbiX [bacterium HR17]|jgi:4-hydroxy-3-polyprenylbenzoate decarboxylase|uniref:Flavin prenyltransferase UbiX n=1 Tax=Candidatus Fervidibacter japonicus TaxID=2035412 RepID=A0A2H5XBH3_9BACT|nr:Flavin prenyltransferase UbiX [bacterium HR17]